MELKTTNDIKYFLNQYKLLEDRIKDKEYELEKLRHLSTSIASPNFDIKVTKSRNYDNLGDIISAIFDLTKEIANQKLDLLKLQLNISVLINNIENQEYKRLLELRYIKCDKWENIADDMGYSLKSVHRIHNRALENILENAC